MRRSDRKTPGRPKTGRKPGTAASAADTRREKTTGKSGLIKKAGRYSTFAVLALVVVYLGFQAVRFFGSPYQTEAVFSYSTGDTLPVNGLFVRDEKQIEGAAQGIRMVAVSNAAKVPAGTEVAYVYQNEADVDAVREIAVLDAHIRLLQQASDPAVINSVHPDVLSQQALERISALTGLAPGQKLDGMTEMKNDVLRLLSLKNIATGREEGFADKIAQLKQQREKLQKEVSSSPAVITAPATGYYVGSSDGYEQKVTPASLKGLTPAQIDGYLAAEIHSDSTSYGKLIGDFHWYFAFAASAEQAGHFKPGQSLSLDFAKTGVPKVKATVESVTADESSGRSTVVLASDYLVPALLEGRTAPATVVFNTYSGLRISPEAVRFVDGEKGVFIKQNELARFKKIEDIYENNDFVICKEHPEDSEYLQLFDEVIIGGKDLYDKKPLY